MHLYGVFHGVFGGSESSIYIGDEARCSLPGRTRAEVAEIFGISRARVTQCLNLLKLPPVIVGFLEANDDTAILHYFTERRLRPLTRLADDQEKWDQFEDMLAECLCPDFPGKQLQRK